VLAQAVESFLAVPLEKRLYLIDNSANDYFKDCFPSKEVKYLHTGKNLGFGKAHNLIIDELSVVSDYHLVLNPDAYFGSDVIPLLLEQMKSMPDLGIIAPKIKYPDGSFQKSIRRFPRPYDFLLRRIPGLKHVFRTAFEKGNYLSSSADSPIKVDAVSGCFQIFRTSVFTEIKGFDDRYFMYMEDLDICRKVHRSGYKVLYYPKVSVFHHSAYGSKKSAKLFWIHVKSIFQYFRKWSLKK